MQKREDENRLLFDLAYTKRPRMVRLPYTAEFYAVCKTIGTAATIEDIHCMLEAASSNMRVSKRPQY